MAYAEKRGKGPAPWRVKYKLPNGTETSESGFETKAPAQGRLLPQPRWEPCLPVDLPSPKFLPTAPAGPREPPSRYGENRN